MEIYNSLAEDNVNIVISLMLGFMTGYLCTEFYLMKDYTDSHMIFALIVGVIFAIIFKIMFALIFDKLSAFFRSLLTLLMIGVIMFCAISATKYLYICAGLLEQDY